MKIVSGTVELGEVKKDSKLLNKLFGFILDEGTMRSMDLPNNSRVWITVELPKGESDERNTCQT